MANDGKKWNINDNIEVNHLLNVGTPLDVITARFGRTPESILWKAINDIKDKKYQPGTYDSSIYIGLKNIPFYKKLCNDFGIPDDDEIIHEEEEAEEDYEEGAEEEAEEEAEEDNEDDEDDDEDEDDDKDADEAEDEDAEDENDKKKYKKLVVQLEKLCNKFADFAENAVTINIHIETIQNVMIAKN